MARDSVRKSPRLPVQQLAILVICRVAEPVVLTSVYPYIPEMIESFGVPRDQIPKWAGITSAVFSVSQSLTAIAWGRVSDRFGRKPAIITGLTCTMICSLIWGFSTNLAMAITARGIQGAFNGNVGTIRTMVAEMVPEKELQPRAFSIMPMIWSLGSTFGPSFGGFFAKPAEHMPGLFGKNAFFIKFPFALPNILASALFLVGISTAILFLKETHIVLRYNKDYGLLLGKKISNSVHKFLDHLRFFNGSSKLTQDEDMETSPLLASNRSLTSKSTISTTPKRKPTKLSEVFTWQTSLNLFTNAFLSMHSVSYDQLLPIFMHNPPDIQSKPLGISPIKFSGGFGLDSSRIGTLFTVYGILSCIVQFLIFPYIARCFGILNCFKASAIIFPVVYFLTPYAALIQSSLYQQIYILIIMALKSVAIIFAFPCSLILLTNSAKSLTVLGTLNGFAVSVASVGRAIGPAICGPAFSWGIKNDYIITPWWLLGILSIIGATPIWWLVEGEGFANRDTEERGKLSKSSDISNERSGAESVPPNDEEALLSSEHNKSIERR